MQRWRRERGRLHARAEMSPLDDMSLTAAIRTWGHLSVFPLWVGPRGFTWIKSRLIPDHDQCKPWMHANTHDTIRMLKLPESPDPISVEMKEILAPENRNSGRVRQPWLVFHRSQAKFRKEIRQLDDEQLHDMISESSLGQLWSMEWTTGRAKDICLRSLACVSIEHWAILSIFCT